MSKEYMRSSQGCHQVTHNYGWSMDDHNTMTIWEDNKVLSTISECYSDCKDCFDCTLEKLFEEVVFEMRGVDLACQN